MQPPPFNSINNIVLLEPPAPSAPEEPGAWPRIALEENPAFPGPGPDAGRPAAEGLPRSAGAGIPPLLLWQLMDSAFPTGGFAHSGGLEAAWQQGEVRNRAELHLFMATASRQAGQGGLPFVNAAHDAPTRLDDWDHECEAFTSGHVGNRASRLQGRAFLMGVERLGANAPSEEPAPRPPYCHLAPVLGAVLARLGADRETAGRVYLFQQVRGWLAAAVRLSIVGPMEAQALQCSLGPRLEQILVRCATLGIEDAAQTAPLLDLWQGSQDRLFSRLFQT